MFSRKIIAFYKSLKPSVKLPAGISWIDPFSSEVLKICEEFHNKYYKDNRKRIFLFGINPGRFGAGVTGIPFTDPLLLQDKCGIENDFQKRHELSSVFIHEMIDAYGGMEAFTKDFFISSICPLGFIKDNKNINYYDDKDLQQKVEPFILKSIRQQLAIGANTKVAFSLGQGKNFKYFKEINEQHAFFKEVLPLPHPRWIMQYKRKRKQEFIDLYIERLTNSK